MIEFIEYFFSSEGFPARKDCGDWSSVMIILGVVSSSMLFFSYAGIGFLWLGLRLASDKIGIREYNSILGSLAAIFLTCGFSHLIGGAIVFFHGWYRFIIAWDVMTALVGAIGFPRAMVLVYGMYSSHVEAIRLAKSISEETLASAPDEIRKIADYLKNQGR